MNFQKFLAELDAADDRYAETLAADLVNTVSEWAAANGWPQLVRDFTPAAGPTEVRKYLAECIAATKVQGDELLTLEQAAEILGYTPSGLRKIVNRTKAGKPGIRFSQIGNGPIKFKREWLDDFTVANMAAPKPRAKPQHWR